MENDEHNADSEERIAQLEAALQGERARNAELQERLQALGGREAQGGQYVATLPSGSGSDSKLSWRRVVVGMSIASIGLLVVPYAFFRSVLHWDPILSLTVAILFALFTNALVIVLLAADPGFSRSPRITRAQE